jgi:hypothetical protein
MNINAAHPRDQSLLQAACEGNISLLASVDDAVLQSTVCTSGCTVLHWAAGANQVETLRYLVLQRGMPVDIPVAKRAASGRTALHYACRNGALQAAQCLVQELGANVNHKAKQGVTPFQLAVFQNRLEICQWLVEECHVDPTQVNDFGCGAVHWLGIVPIHRADDGEAGAGLLPLARWLQSLPGIDFRAKQKSGHTALHKSSWMGHLALVEFLHQECDLWDDAPDDAGNYAAVLADMANTPRHRIVAEYLRQHASREREESCAVLGLQRKDLEAAEEIRIARIRAAYKAKVRLLHPDKKQTSDDLSEFHAVQKAYHHLLHCGGRGTQENPTHQLPLMLDMQGNALVVNKEDDDVEFFKARLLAVIMEFGKEGLDMSNVRKKWQQVWPHVGFPTTREPLNQFIQRQAGDVVEFRRDEQGFIRLHALSTSQLGARSLLK